MLDLCFVIVLVIFCVYFDFDFYKMLCGVLYCFVDFVIVCYSVGLLIRLMVVCVYCLYAFIDRMVFCFVMIKRDKKICCVVLFCVGWCLDWE